MAITRIKNSSINNKTPKYNDVLAGLPFRPIIGTATDGGNGTSVSVAFTGNNVANGTITYTALSSPGSLTGTGTASPITVSGLTAGTAYTFQVKAGNSLGDSAYSAASNSVTPVTPTAFESIASTTLSSATSTITFSSIPSTYQHLQLRLIAKGNRAATVSTLRLTLNSDTAANYVSHTLIGDGATATAGNGTGGSNWDLAKVTGNTADANTFGVAILDIHDYASTTKNKTLRCFAGVDMNGTGEAQLRSGLWINTAAVNRIDIVNQTSTILAGTVIALYGIKGA